jgi:hypothetical protein
MQNVLGASTEDEMGATLATHSIALCIRLLSQSPQQTRVKGTSSPGHNRLTVGSYFAYVPSLHAYESQGPTVGDGLVGVSAVSRRMRL